MEKRILVVNANWVGDVLFSTPALRALRKHYPDAKIACVVPPRAKAVLARNPRLDEVIAASDDTRALAFLDSWKLASRLRGKFDAAFFLHRSRTKARVAAQAGISERIGFAWPGRQAGLTRAVPPPPPAAHRIDHYLALLEGVGIPADGRRPEFFPAPEAEGEARRLLGEAGIAAGEPYVAMHPGGNWDLKRWPADSFVKWIRLFRAQRPWKVVICGTAPEARLAESIRSNFKNDEAVSLCGKTSFDGLAWVLKGAKMLLSNDSGPIHLAATQETPILGLFGPTHPERTGPVSGGRSELLWNDVGCEVPCYFRSCDFRACMETLTPEMAAERSLALC